MQGLRQDSSRVSTATAREHRLRKADAGQMPGKTAAEQMPHMAAAEQAPGKAAAGQVPDARQTAPEKQVPARQTPAERAQDTAQASTTRSGFIARAGVIAALYAALTLLTLTALGGLAFGPVQLRLSEAVCVLALFTRAAIPGLTIGCAAANLIGIALTGSGALGLLDVLGGSAATFLGALWCWRLRSHVGLALLGPVVANALVVSAYLPLMLAALGFYTIPFTTLDLAASYPLMFCFGAVAIGLGEALVLYGLGLPLATGLKRTPVAAWE